MEVYRLKAKCKDYLWGGESLKTRYHIEFSGSPLAEAWVLSCHKDGESEVLLAGGNCSLPEYLAKHPEAKGTLGNQFQEFPLLIKLIDAKLPLSVQVHPDDIYAMAHEGQLGKTEVWVILEREEGAFLYFGFERDYTKEEIRKAIEEKRLTDLLRKVPVEKGDVFFIPAGTVHAIGAGILLIEIQENSNLTYRVYDYGRKDKNGKERELHIEKALEVMQCKRAEEAMVQEQHLASCPYFTVDRITLSRGKTYQKEVSEDSFLSAILIAGSGTIRQKKGNREKELSSLSADFLPAKQGDSFFIPAGAGKVEFSGEGEWLLSYLEACGFRY